MARTSEFISSGAFEERLGRMRKCYTERRDALMSALERECRRLGVGICSLTGSPTHRIAHAAHHELLVLLGYPNLDNQKLCEAVRRIGDAARDEYGTTRTLRTMPSAAVVAVA